MSSRGLWRLLFGTATLALLVPVAPVTAEQRERSSAEIFQATQNPHPYARDLQKLVASTMKGGTLWGTFRDPEDGRRYVGHEACKPCHYDRHTTWSETKMARAVRTIADFNRGIFLNDSRCLSCHTTGFDPARDNGGFDEGIAGLENVQCEACHGAGSLMVQKADRRFILRSNDADLCGRCHGLRYGNKLCFPEYDEWKTSAHARSLQRLTGATGLAESCLECHSADAIVPPSDRRLTLATAKNGVTCQACHDPMVRTFPALKDNNQLRKPKMELCQWCHAARAKMADGLPHAPQAQMWGGTGGAEFPGEKYQSGLMNADIERGCLTCHALADRGAENAYQGHTFLPNLLACRRCHPDLESFDRKGVQERTRRLLRRLDGKLLRYPAGQRESETYRKARFNYFFVLRDRSLGIHNSDYSRKLLTDSIRYVDQGLDQPPSP